MSNVVKNLIEDAAFRLGDPDMNDSFPEPAIRTAMNAVYQQINEETKIVTATLEIEAGDLSDTVNYVDLPDGWIEPFNIAPTADSGLYTLTFVPKEMWNPNFHVYQDVFTVINGQIVFGNAGDDTAHTIYYKSSGKILVNAEDADVVAGGTYPPTTYANTPEWKTRYYRALVYATCLEISSDYPQAPHDAAILVDMKSNMKRDARNRQMVTPNVVGGYAPGQRQADPDYIDGMVVTRY